MQAHYEYEKGKNMVNKYIIEKYKLRFNFKKHQPP